MCPEGGYCPGGGRVWPEKGFWSPDEQTPPVACPNADACAGRVVGGDTSGADAARTGDASCTEGFEGKFCAFCAQGYYASGVACLTCGLAEEDERELIIAVSTACSYYMSVVFFAGRLEATSFGSLARKVRVCISVVPT